MPRARTRGRPLSDEPLAARHLVRMTEADEAEFLAEIERLSMVTGTKWTMSGYLRMCGRAMKGKHLS